MNQPLFSRVDQYIDELFAPEDEILRATIESLDTASMPQHSISPNQGKLLQLLAQSCQAKKILEIGTLGAYSTIWLARALPSNGTLITIERDPAYAAIAQTNIQRANLEQHITLLVGDAVEILQTIDDTFDFIFIDADKPSYTQYFEWAVKHAHSGTLIIADNVIREGAVIDTQATDEKVLGVQAFNAYLATNTKVSATILPTVGQKGYDGMAIAIVH